MATKRLPPIPLNRTPDGQLACAYGTPWLDHFALPVGTGKGCAICDRVCVDAVTKELK